MCLCLCIYERYEHLMMKNWFLGFVEDDDEKNTLYY